MAVVSRSLLTFGASLLSARAATRLRRGKSGCAHQEAVFARMIPALSRAWIWKHAGVEPRMGYDAFRAQIPLQTYRDLAPHIEEMKKGVADLLWPGQCHIYATSAGTTDESPKHVPVTEAMLAHFRRAGLDAMLWYTARAGSARVFRGRHLLVGGSTALVPIPESAPFEAYTGELGGIAALNRPRWVERHLYEPGAEIAEIADWPSKVSAIAERTVGSDITLLAGMPGWILILAEALRARAAESGARVAHLQEIWPHFECFVHGGVPIGPYQDELRTLLGPTVHFHEVYAASEGFIAAQDAEASAGLRLMANAGIFFEFLPMADFDEAELPGLGSKAVPLSGVSPGVDYALLLTTPGGLARYVIGDVVRFVSTEPPRLVYVGRTKLQLSAAGERVSERDVTEALQVVCRRNGWSITSFHVAPIYAVPLARARARHEWWVELKPGTLITPTGPIMAVELDAELGRLNRGYDGKRKGGALDSPFVRLVMPGVFEKWMRHHGKWGGQNKMPRCRSDRIIADELGAALQFAKD